jgi:RNA polymerase sigma-70 factor, ECF subfamily
MGGGCVDAAGFDAFYTASFPRLGGEVYAMCGDLGEAQDCVQEAFVRAWDRHRQLEAVQAQEAWIRIVAWRLAVSRWRRARRALSLADRSRPPVPPPEPDIEHTALVTALKQIPEDQRRAIVLHHLCDLPVDEVARETGVAVGTVKARLSRGRKALAVLLSDEWAKERDHA